MIYGIGTDLCDLRRLDAALQRRGDRLAQRILGDAEWPVYVGRRARVAARGLAFLGTRFAAKEAFAKAIGLGMRQPMQWRDCETLNAPSGQPQIHLHGPLAAWFSARGLRAHVTLTDEVDHAAAFVVVETDAPASFTDLPGSRPR